MNPFPSPLIAASLGSLFMGLMYLYIYRQYREKYVGLWTMSWSLYSLRYVFLLRLTATGPQPLLHLAFQIVDLFSSLLLFSGIYLFLELSLASKVRRTISILLLLDGLWMVVATIARVPYDVMSLPNRLLLAALNLWLGFVILRTPHLRGIGKQAAGAAFLAVGAHRGFYAFRILFGITSSWSNFVYVVAEVLAAWGILLAYFERARRNLSSSERRFRLLAENAQDVIYRYRVSEPQGFEYVSPSVTNILAYSPEEFYATPRLVLRLIHPEDRSVLLAKIREPNGDDLPLTLRLRRKNGDYIWSEQRITIVRDQTGKPLAVEGILRDVSSRKRVEEQLFQIQKLETVGQLAGGIAHEFNNLMMIISGHANFALESLSSESPMADDIRQVLRAAERATSLTNQLLSLSRRQFLQPKLFDINEKLASISAVLGHIVGESVEVTLRLHGGTLPVEADPSRLEEILVIMAANARDAMPEGGTLTLATCRAALPVGHNDHLADEPEVSEYVCLTVRDTGTGMTEEVMSHLFEPFFTTKEIGAGTGLGLATVYGIVKQHHGEILVESTPDEGTAFHLYFPLAATNHNNQQA